MPWQRQVADIALETDPATGMLAYRTVILTIPRQQGKTTLLLPVWLQRAVSWERQNIAWTMQSAKDAREKWEDEHVPVVMASPIERAIARVRKTNGSEAVIFRNGSIQRLMASTSSAGHGKVLDLGIVDEAFAQTDDRLEQAMRPAMRTRPQPQMWLVSTMGTMESVWFHGWCDAGRAAVESGVAGPVAYFEWSADDDADPGDPETWWSCMPAMGFTITEDTIRQEYEQAMLTPDGLSGFRRASLNQRTALRTDPVIPASAWAACLDRRSEIAGRVVLSVDMPPNRAAVSIGACGARADGLAHVELVERRLGTSWLAERLSGLLGRHEVAAVVVDAAGPAGGLLVDVEDVCGRAGVPVVKPGGREYAQACGGFFDAETADPPQLRHIGQVEVEQALQVATRQFSSDAWRWSRRSTDVDISPLVALTLARFGWLTLTPPPSSSPFVFFG